MNARKLAEQSALVEELQTIDNGSGEFSRQEIIQAAERIGIRYPRWIIESSEHKVRRGVWSLASMFNGDPAPARPAPVLEVVTSQPAQAKVLTQAKLAMQIENLVPIKLDTYVPFGFYSDMSKILKSQIFYPTFISGLSGNGKTTMVEQVCAKLKREAIRVNISVETDEDDLIGGNTLVDGNVVYREGPVLTAMKRGAVLILDEIDRGTNKLMCLQAILEGKPYFNKKTGDTITPAPGFNIIATANTKGRGSDDGKFISSQILDEAFLERFAITVEQEYPTATVEKKIVLNMMERDGNVDEKFADHLVTWATVIRKTFADGAIEDLISTRRLEHIVKAFAVFNNREKAIELCIARFDEETKSAFMDLYTKVDPESNVELSDDATVEVEPEDYMDQMGPGGL